MYISPGQWAYSPIHVIWHDFVGTYRYWVPKYESRPTDRNSRYIWIPIFRFCQKLKLVFRSPQTLALSKFTTESGSLALPPLSICLFVGHIIQDYRKRQIELYWFSATGKSMYRLRSVNKNHHFFRIVFVLTKSMSVYSKDPKANQQGKPQNEP